MGSAVGSCHLTIWPTVYTSLYKPLLIILSRPISKTSQADLGKRTVDRTASVDPRPSKQQARIDRFAGTSALAESVQQAKLENGAV